MCRLSITAYISNAKLCTSTYRIKTVKNRHKRTLHQTNDVGALKSPLSAAICWKSAWRLLEVAGEAARCVPAPRHHVRRNLVNDVKVVGMKIQIQVPLFGIEKCGGPPSLPVRLRLAYNRRRTSAAVNGGSTTNSMASHRPSWQHHVMSHILVTHSAHDIGECMQL